MWVLLIDPPLIALDGPFLDRICLFQLELRQSEKF
jgi:hypothetical protein